MYAKSEHDDAVCVQAPIYSFVVEEGARVLRDCRKRKLGAEATALAVYRRMEELMHVVYLASPERVQ